MTSPRLLHITRRARWNDAIAEDATSFVDPSLAAEGFIHCSTVDQVLIPANERFAGQSDLILLVIDPALVSCPIVFEDCYDSGHAFPHIYGPIPVESVIATIDFRSGPDGRFVLPDEVQAMHLIAPETPAD